MHVVQIILMIPLTVLFAGSGLAKLAGANISRADAERFGYPYSRFRIVGALELAAAAGLVVGLFMPTVAAMTAVGLILLMIGAFLTHLRVKDPVAKAVPSAVIGLVAAAVIPLALM